MSTGSKICDEFVTSITKQARNKSGEQKYIIYKKIFRRTRC